MHPIIKMDMIKIRKLCYFEVIAPGLAILNGTNESYMGPTCHIMSLPGPGDPEWWLETPAGLVILATIGIVLAVGVFLLLRRMRRKKALKKQFNKGTISGKEYEKLR